MNVIFTPLKDFHDEDLRSHYCVGLNYTIKPDNKRLQTKAKEWHDKGLIRFGSAEGTGDGEARVKGSGTVT